MNKQIKALIFDFDGLILETESPIYKSWQLVYQMYGQQLQLEQWVNTIGTWDDPFSPYTDLEVLLGNKLDWQTIEPQRHDYEMSLVMQQEVLPGVREYLCEARRLGLKIGLASSSDGTWVYGHLQRLGLMSHFDCTRVREDVRRAKPDPELYLSATACLGVNPAEAIALEDSQHGITAARAAGLYAVAVPHNLTAHLPFTEAHLRLESLADVPLEQLIARVEAL